MRKILALTAICVLLGATGAQAGPWEDGMVAYNSGDYVPAMKLFRPLAQAGNAKAQSVVGVMYHKGEGVGRSSAHAFMWFSVAAQRGDAKAKAGLREVSKDMTPAEMAAAKQMTATCEASLYRDCDY